MAATTEVKNQVESILDNIKILYNFEYIDYKSFTKFLEILEEILLVDKKETFHSHVIYYESTDQQNERAKNRSLAKKLLAAKSLYY
jgi:hypothetical protein